MDVDATAPRRVSSRPEPNRAGVPNRPRPPAPGTASERKPRSPLLQSRAGRPGDWQRPSATWRTPQVPASGRIQPVARPSLRGEIGPFQPAAIHRTSRAPSSTVRGPDAVAGGRLAVRTPPGPAAAWRGGSGGSANGPPARTPPPRGPLRGSAPYREGSIGGGGGGRGRGSVPGSGGSSDHGGSGGSGGGGGGNWAQSTRRALHPAAPRGSATRGGPAARGGRAARGALGAPPPPRVHYMTD